MWAPNLSIELVYRVTNTISGQLGMRKPGKRTTHYVLFSSNNHTRAIMYYCISSVVVLEAQQPQRRQKINIGKLEENSLNE